MCQMWPDERGTTIVKIESGSILLQRISTRGEYIRIIQLRVKRRVTSRDRASAKTKHRIVSRDLSSPNVAMEVRIM